MSQQEFAARAAEYEAATEILGAMVATGCYWGRPQHEFIWVKCLQRICNPAAPGGGSSYQFWQYFSFYPAVILLYACGIAAITAKNYKTFMAVAWKPIIRRSPNDQNVPLVLVANSEGVLSSEEGQWFNVGHKVKTPVSDHLYGVLRPLFLDLLPDEVEYQRSFDAFEYLVSLCVFHYRGKKGLEYAYAPFGSYIWRATWDPLNVVDQLAKEAAECGNDWPPLKAGLFEGSFAVFDRVRQEFHSSEFYRLARLR